MKPSGDTEYAFVGPQNRDVPPFAFDLRAWVPQPGGDDQRPVRAIDTLIVHRAGGPDWPRDTEGLIDALLPYWPGQVCPYWAFVEHDARVVIATDLEDKGAHAAAWNRRGLGVAVVGDFRVEDPTDVQVDAVTDLLVWACRRLGLHAGSITGHTTLPRSTRHPDKSCPGRRFPIVQVRQDVRTALLRGPP